MLLIWQDSYSRYILCNGRGTQGVAVAHVYAREYALRAIVASRLIAVIGRKTLRNDSGYGYELGLLQLDVVLCHRVLRHDVVQMLNARCVVVVVVSVPVVVVMVKRTLLNDVAPQPLMMVVWHNGEHHQHECC